MNIKYLSEIDMPHLPQEVLLPQHSPAPNTPGAPASLLHTMVGACQLSPRKAESLCPQRQARDVLRVQ